MWGGVALDLHLNPPYLSGAVIMLSAFFLRLAWISGEKSEAAL
jgi:hypothetical protein